MKKSGGPPPQMSAAPMGGPQGAAPTDPSVPAPAAPAPQPQEAPQQPQASPPMGNGQPWNQQQFAQQLAPLFAKGGPMQGQQQGAPPSLVNPSQQMVTPQQMAYQGPMQQPQYRQPQQMPQQPFQSQYAPRVDWRAQQQAAQLRNQQMYGGMADQYRQRMAMMNAPKPTVAEQMAQYWNSPAGQAQQAQMDDMRASAGG